MAVRTRGVPGDGKSGEVSYFQRTGPLVTKMEEAFEKILLDQNGDEVSLPNVDFFLDYVDAILKYRSLRLEMLELETEEGNERLKDLEGDIDSAERVGREVGFSSKMFVAILRAVSNHTLNKEEVEKWQGKVIAARKRIASRHSSPY